MKIDCLRLDDWTVMVLRGDVDSFTYPIWAKELNVLMRTGVKKLRIDLTLGSIYNLKSMQIVVSTLGELHNRNGELEVVGVNDETREMIELMVRANSQLQTAPLRFMRQDKK